ncbi:winged helix-turn-helix transcriptional regulator [Rhizobium sp.]|uniref:winged helix-turn-helix transcriptional regulator n=1 Tax=Rhizobium sp. TaxID=391 RepID=UPI0034C68078
MHGLVERFLLLVVQASLGNDIGGLPFQGRQCLVNLYKWTILIVRMLGRGPWRFNTLRREVGEISQKALASTLRDLEENGLVSRTVTPVDPPQVEYALTDLGRDFLRPIRGLAEWVLENGARIEAARAEYATRASG